MPLFKKLFGATLTHEEEVEYGNTFETNMQEAKYWIACSYLIALLGYLSVITPLVVDSDTNVFTMFGICITLFALVLCAIVVIILLVDTESLSLSKKMPFSLVNFSGLIALVSVMGGCFQFFGRIVNGQCEEDQDTNTCNPMHDQGHFPSDALLLIGAFLIFAQVVGCVHCAFTVHGCWLPIILTMIFSASRYEIINSASSIMTLFFM
jgi:hypothetical protein